jgi:hypothetical protein
MIPTARAKTIPGIFAPSVKSKPGRKNEGAKRKLQKGAQGGKKPDAFLAARGFNLIHGSWLMADGSSPFAQGNHAGCTTCVSAMSHLPNCYLTAPRVSSRGPRGCRQTSGTAKLSNTPLRNLTG